MPTDLKELLKIPRWEWPGYTAKRLLETLKDPQADASQRVTAAELSGDLTVIHDELAGAMLAVLGNAAESEEIRANAAVAFGPVLEIGYTLEFEDPDDVPISEEMFHHIQESLEHYYRDTTLPKLVRRRVLEGAVRAPQDWQEAAVREAYASGDRDWVLTAVFAMKYVNGKFDKEIRESLASKDLEIHYEAVEAAGANELGAAWPHIAGLINDPHTPKDLLLAAIEAVGQIRPAEARTTLRKLAISDDEDIADAVDETVSMAQSRLELDAAEDDGDDEDFDDEDSEEEDDGERVN